MIAAIADRELDMFKATKTLGALALTTALASAASTAQAAVSSDAYAAFDRAGHAIVVTLKVKPEAVEAFKAVMQARSAEMRAEPHVVDFRMLAAEEANTFVVFESFTAKDAFESTLKAPESAAFMERIKPLLAAPLEVQRLEPAWTHAAPGQG
jgi:quinol monooxygenase YgiN